MSNSTTSIPITPTELFKEKTAWDILRASRRIQVNKFNYVTTFLAFVGLSVFAFFASDTQYLVNATRTLASYWLSIGLNTLGFLVSGFAIYTALGKPSLFIKMAQKPHTASGLSWLKYVLFVFIQVLIFYIAFAAFCGFIIIFCAASGPVTKLMQFMEIGEVGKHILASLGYIATGTGTVWSIVILHSYIYNIYSSVLACVLSESLEAKSQQSQGS